MKGRAAAAAAVVLAITLAGCTRGGSRASTFLASPVATSIQAPQGTFATVAMGDLTDPLNTFWQLLVRPAGSSRWSDQVAATAVATNGGLILSGEGPRVEVAARPSDLLKFTPLILTKDGGRTWKPDGLLPSPVAAGPSALATSATATAGLVAIAGGGRRQQLLSRPAGSSAWTPIATPSTFAACHAGALTAVAYDRSGPVVGVACRTRGVAGIFEQAGTGWQLIGPRLPGAGASQVLALRSTPAGLSALIGDGRSIWAVFRGGSGWSVTPPVPLKAVTSLGEDGDGWFVLAPDGTLSAVPGSAVPWRRLPRPPAGTATAAFGPGPPVALAVAANGTTLDIWQLSVDGATWKHGQTIEVPIQFGSSG